MMESPDRHSAEILPFPAGGRTGLGGRSGHARAAETSDTPRTAKVVSGAWYHEEAIEEARRGRKL